MQMGIKSLYDIFIKTRVDKEFGFDNPDLPKNVELQQKIHLKFKIAWLIALFTFPIAAAFAIANFLRLLNC